MAFWQGPQLAYVLSISVLVLNAPVHCCTLGSDNVKHAWGTSVSDAQAGRELSLSADISGKVLPNALHCVF
jgi:hypothetical protein